MSPTVVKAGAVGFIAGYTSIEAQVGVKSLLSKFSSPMVQCVCGLYYNDFGSYYRIASSFHIQLPKIQIHMPPQCVACVETNRWGVGMFAEKPVLLALG